MKNTCIKQVASAAVKAQRLCAELSLLSGYLVFDSEMTSPVTVNQLNLVNNLIVEFPFGIDNSTLD